MGIAFFPAADSGTPQFFAWPSNVPLPWGAVAMMPLPTSPLSFGSSMRREGAAEVFLAPGGITGFRATGNQIVPALAGGGLAALGYGIVTKSKAVGAVGVGLLLWAAFASLGDYEEES